MGIDTYSTAPANNTALFPEGMPRSQVNDSARQVQADIRTFYNDPQWVIYGDGDGSAMVLFASGTSFTVQGADVTAAYHAGRRVKAVGSLTGTIYGTISSSGFATNTTVNVTWDSGSLQNEALTIYLGALSATGSSIPPSLTLANPMTTLGDLITRNATVPARLAVGAANTVLRSDGTVPAYGKVAVADLTNGTDGELITWDSSGVAATVAVGTAGHVLTSGGAGVAPTFQAPAQAGWAVLAEQDASASATIDFVLTSHLTNYYDFQVMLSHVTPSAAANLLMRTSTDGGSTYDSGASTYNYAIVGLDDTATARNAGSASATAIQLNNSQTVDNGLSGQIYIHAPSVAFPCKVTWHLFYVNAATVRQIAFGSGDREANADVDAIRFLFSSGTVSSGKFTLLGRRKFA